MVTVVVGYRKVLVGPGWAISLLDLEKFLSSQIHLHTVLPSPNYKIRGLGGRYQQYVINVDLFSCNKNT